MNLLQKYKKINTDFLKYFLRDNTDTNSHISRDEIAFISGLSRSGTTLLSVMLDSHPRVVFGAELLPVRLPQLSVAEKIIKLYMLQHNYEYKFLGSYIKENFDRDLGVFITRIYRSGITFDDMMRVLLATSKFNRNHFDLRSRMEIAFDLIRTRVKRENALLSGFKFSSSSLFDALCLFPNGKFICIVRDPRDVVLSQLKRGFSSSVERICKNWNAYIKNYRKFQKIYPDNIRIIRYEDLVRSPMRLMSTIFEILTIDIDDSIFKFYSSSSPIHNGSHPNARRLRMNFQVDNIGLGRKNLSKRQINTIESICKESIVDYGYSDVSLANIKDKKLNLIAINQITKHKQKIHFSRKRRFVYQDYENLLEAYNSSHEIMPINQFVRIDDIGSRKILMIRHDVDHDIDNAVLLAAWEAKNNIRSTYCILHTAWYYGRLDGSRYLHSNLLINSILKILSFGHEINFHNNLIALSLKHGVDPYVILESELSFFQSIGVPIVGTSSHGDSICRQLNFRNWEMFRECCDDRFGGVREVINNSNGKNYKVALAQRSMFDFSLEYEAYDIGKDVYHTESGGNLRVRYNTKSRKHFNTIRDENSSVCGILTHPVWWELRS